MKERPILFSGPMVRAILEGRKLQTRRVVRPQPNNPGTFGISPIWGHGIATAEGRPIPGVKPGHYFIHAAFNESGMRVDRFLGCPFGKPGDRLWVRETFLVGYDLDGNDRPVGEEKVFYRATGDAQQWMTGESDFPTERVPWKPSIHMPRWASRISLEITDIRIEQLQDITDTGGMREGWECDPTDLDYLPRMWFRDLWNSLNAKRGLGWDVNPWVWVIEFTRVHPHNQQAAAVA